MRMLTVRTAGSIQNSIECKIKYYVRKYTRSTSQLPSFHQLTNEFPGLFSVPPCLLGMTVEKHHRLANLAGLEQVRAGYRVLGGGGGGGRWRKGSDQLPTPL